MAMLSGPDKNPCCDGSWMCAHNRRGEVAQTRPHTDEERAFVESIPFVKPRCERENPFTDDPCILTSPHRMHEDKYGETWFYDDPSLEQTRLDALDRARERDAERAEVTGFEHQ